MGNPDHCPRCGLLGYHATAVECVGPLRAALDAAETEAADHRERANRVQAAWEGHQDTCCRFRLAREIEQALGLPEGAPLEDGLEAIRRLREAAGKGNDREQT